MWPRFNGCFQIEWFVEELRRKVYKRILDELQKRKVVALPIRRYWSHGIHISTNKIIFERWQCLFKEEEKRRPIYSPFLGTVFSSTQNGQAWTERPSVVKSKWPVFPDGMMRRAWLASLKQLEMASSTAAWTSAPMMHATTNLCRA